MNQGEIRGVKRDQVGIKERSRAQGGGSTRLRRDQEGSRQDKGGMIDRSRGLKEELRRGIKEGARQV